MEEEIVLIEENDIEKIEIEEENYSGKPYTLPIASKDVLGGIKVGNNLTIDEDGTLNAQAEGSGSNAEDTGWKDCEIGEEGKWSRFKYRKIGSRVRIEGRVSQLPFEGLEYTIGKIPIEYAPPSTINTYGYTTKNMIARFCIATSGEIKFSWNLNLTTGSDNRNPTWYNFDFEYLLD